MVTVTVHHTHFCSACESAMLLTLCIFAVSDKTFTSADLRMIFTPIRVVITHAVLCWFCKVLCSGVLYSAILFLLCISYVLLALYSAICCTSLPCALSCWYVACCTWLHWIMLCIELKYPHPQRRNVTTSVVGLKTVTYAKISPKNGEPQRYSWERRRRRSILKVGNGERLIELCEVLNMCIANTFFPHREIHKVTWNSPDDRTKNQIDHFLRKKQIPVKHIGCQGIQSSRCW